MPSLLGRTQRHRYAKSQGLRCRQRSWRQGAWAQSLWRMYSWAQVGRLGNRVGWRYSASRKLERYRDAPNSKIPSMLFDTLTLAKSVPSSLDSWGVLVFTYRQYRGFLMHNRVRSQLQISEQYLVSISVFNWIIRRKEHSPILSNSPRSSGFFESSFHRR